MQCATDTGSAGSAGSAGAVLLGRALRATGTEREYMDTYAREAAARVERARVACEARALAMREARAARAAEKTRAARETRVAEQVRAAEQARDVQQCVDLVKTMHAILRGEIIFI